MEEYNGKQNCPKIRDNLASCTCSYNPCNRKGLCCQCIAYHRKRKEIPGCLFSASIEKTYPWLRHEASDRSISNFISSVNR